MDKNSNRSGKKSEPSRFEKKQDSRPSENNKGFGKGKDFGGNREERPFRSREDNKFGGAPRPERSFGDKGKSFGGNREERPFRSREDNKFGGAPRPERSFGDKGKSFGGNREERPFRSREDNKFGGAPRPERSFGDKGKSFGGNREERPFRSREDNKFGGAPRPERSFGDKGKSFGGNREERPFRSREDNKFGGAPRPERSFGDKGKSFGGNREERPFRSREDNKFGGAPRPERSFGDKGKSFGGNREERPFRSREDNSRPERGFDDKAKSFGGAKPERSFGEKGRDFGGEREGKPFRSRGENNFGGAPRPERSFGDKGKSFGGAKPERSFDKGRTRDNNKFNDNKSGKGFGKGKKSDKDEFNFASRNHEITQEGPPSYDLRHYEKHHKNDDGSEDAGIRLNRHIANSGVCSRRDADKLIESGQITVNGNVVTEMGFRVKPTDVIHYGKKKLSREKLVYVLLNKPKDFITTTDDPDERKTVMQLVSNACEERIYPVGRLDRNTTGLLLLTNDGELADKLAHPSQKITKIYQVDLDKPVTEEDFEAIKAGLKLEDGVAEVDELEILSPDRSILGIAIHIGRNRIVRRIFEHLGYDVVRLDRVMYASLDKRNLPRGHWRYLDEKEVIHLKYFLK